MTIKISQEYLQIITVRKQEIYYNLYTVYNDVYHISEIEDMTTLPNSKLENGGDLMLKVDRGKTSVVLSAAKRDAILAVSFDFLFLPFKYGFCLFFFFYLLFSIYIYIYMGIAFTI